MEHAKHAAAPQSPRGTRAQESMLLCPETPRDFERSLSSGADVSREASSLPCLEDAAMPLSPCSAVVLSPPQQLRFGDSEAGGTVTEIGLTEIVERRLRFSGDEDVETLTASSDARSGSLSPRLQDEARPLASHSPDRGAGQCLPLCEDAVCAIDATMGEEEAIADVLLLARSLPERWRSMPPEARSRLTGDLGRLHALLQTLPGDDRGEEQWSA